MCNMGLFQTWAVGCILQSGYTRWHSVPTNAALLDTLKSHTGKEQLHFFIKAVLSQIGFNIQVCKFWTWCFLKWHWRLLHFNCSLKLDTYLVDHDVKQKLGSHKVNTDKLCLSEKGNYSSILQRQSKSVLNTAAWITQIYKLLLLTMITRIIIIFKQNLNKMFPKWTISWTTR